jgi:hypothetical protein
MRNWSGKAFAGPRKDLSQLKAVAAHAQTAVFYRRGVLVRLKGRALLGAEAQHGAGQLRSSPPVWHKKTFGT